MTSYSATILLENEHQEALVTLSYAPSFASVQAFAGVLHEYTTANIVRCTFTQATNPQLNGQGGEIAETSFAAHFKLRRIDPDEDVKFRSFRLPAPKLSIFEHLDGVGYRIKDEEGAAVAQAYSALMQEEYVFDSGWLVN